MHSWQAQGCWGLRLPCLPEPEDRMVAYLSLLGGNSVLPAQQERSTNAFLQVAVWINIHIHEVSLSRDFKGYWNSSKNIEIHICYMLIYIYTHIRKSITLAKFRCFLNPAALPDPTYLWKICLYSLAHLHILYLHRYTQTYRYIDG